MIDKLKAAVAKTKKLIDRANVAMQRRDVALDELKQALCDEFPDIEQIGDQLLFYSESAASQANAVKFRMQESDTVPLAKLLAIPYVKSDGIAIITGYVHVASRYLHGKSSWKPIKNWERCARLAGYKKCIVNKINAEMQTCSADNAPMCSADNAHKCLT